MTPPALRALQGAVNRALALDPEAARVLAPLAGARVRVIVTGVPALDVLVTVDGAGVELGRCDEHAPDVTLRGSAPALVALTRNNDAMPASAGVTVSGDVAVLGQLREALRRLSPDWEEPLARLLGDEVAQPLARGARALFAGAARAARELHEDVSEYLREETDWLPRGDDVSDFAADVDTVRDAVDRLEKRIDALERGR